LYKKKAQKNANRKKRTKTHKTNHSTKK